MQVTSAQRERIQHLLSIWEAQHDREVRHLAALEHQLETALEDFGSPWEVTHSLRSLVERQKGVIMECFERIYGGRRILEELGVSL